MLEKKRVLLTITTCKRFDLFCKTIISFSKYCTDLNIIGTIYHYDDSSSELDRRLMIQLIQCLIPKANYIPIGINPQDIYSDNRHMNIMRMWKKDIKVFDYVFHLEDDWLFEKNFSLSDAIEVMSSNSDIAYVGFSWDKKEFPSELFTPRVIGDFWEWYYSDKYGLCEPLFLDDVETSKLPEGHWVKYINWPYFSFRPGIHDVAKISSLETFNSKMDSFELEFSIRFAKLYKSFWYKYGVCKHIGTEISSYELNNSNR